MKHLLLVALLSFNAVAFEIDLSIHDMEHSWRGVNENQHAQFENVFYGLGVAYWFDNIGIRASYLQGDVINTKGRYEYVDVNMKHIISIEALYNVDLTDKLSMFAGVSYNWIPTNQSYEGLDPNSHHANDNDNDEGYLIGLKYNLHKNIYAGFRYNRFSKIKTDNIDEWTDSYSLFMSYKF